MICFLKVLKYLFNRNQRISNIFMQNKMQKKNLRQVLVEFDNDHLFEKNIPLFVKTVFMYFFVAL